MPIRRVRKITAWSYSRLTTWEQCPFKAKMKFLERVEEPEGPALTRGREIEDAVYKYLFTKSVKTLPAAGARFPEELGALKKRASGVLCNRELAFDRTWTPCDWKDWDRVYVRVKMDLLWLSSLKDQFTMPTGSRAERSCCARVRDLKTGKIYEDKLDQLDLYLVAALLLEDGVLPARPDVAEAQMWYLDQGETRTASLLRRDLPKQQAAWDRRARAMLTDEAFLPRPGYYCQRCYLRRANKGPCQY